MAVISLITKPRTHRTEDKISFFKGFYYYLLSKCKTNWPKHFVPLGNSGKALYTLTMKLEICQTSVSTLRKI